MTDRIVFNLKKYLPPDYPPDQPTIYQRFKEGSKTSEWRDASDFWASRLLTATGRQELVVLRAMGKKKTLTRHLKVHEAWLVEGYPPNCLPRIEADIKALIYHSDTEQFEVQVHNLVEVQPALEGATEIDVGHGLTDVSCEHGSRWVWWYDDSNVANFPLGRWEQVVAACDCECGEPPYPFRTAKEVKAHMDKKQQRLMIE